MHCVKCGNEVSTDDKFCSKCGTSINDTAPEKKSFTSKYSSFIALLVVIGVFVCIQLAVNYSNKLSAEHGEIAGAEAIRNGDISPISPTSTTTSTIVTDNVKSEPKILDVIDVENQEFKIDGMKLVKAIKYAYNKGLDKPIIDYKFMGNINGLDIYSISYNMITVNSYYYKNLTNGFISFPAILIGINDKTGNTVFMSVGDPYKGEEHFDDFLLGNFSHLKEGLNSLGYVELWETICTIVDTFDGVNNERYYYSGLNGVYYNYILGETAQYTNAGVYYFRFTAMDKNLKQSYLDNSNSKTTDSNMVDTNITNKRSADEELKKNPIVIMEMQNGDIIKIELYPQIAPKTVNNFISLINKGFYDGLTFHRVMPEFMAQGGDPNGDGTGGPGYTIEGEFTENGFTNNLKHEIGVISMARANEPNSAGSQFFIVTDKNAYQSLDGKYAGFGKVIEGMEAVYRIVNSETIRKQYSPNIQKLIDEGGEISSMEQYQQYANETAEMSRPINPPVIKKMTVETSNTGYENTAQAKVLKSYAILNEQISKPDIVIGDKYFDTQLADISTNFSQYEGKTIEIEGLYMEDSPYTFVGRYSESKLCPYCPQGYSYFEYEWHGEPHNLDLSNEKSWLKIRGLLKRGKDNSEEYYYIDAKSIDVMSEWGVSTVYN